MGRVTGMDGCTVHRQKTAVNSIHLAREISLHEKKEVVQMMMPLLRT